MNKVVYKTKIPEIIAQMEFKADLAVAKASERMTQGAAMRSRVRFGFMKRDWNWEFVGPAEARVFDLIEANQITKGRQYAVFNEYGTHDMAAQPMIWPSLYETIPSFGEDVRDIFSWE